MQNSPLGSGLAREKRLKASSTSAGVQGFGPVFDLFAGVAGPEISGFFFFPSIPYNEQR